MSLWKKLNLDIPDVNLMIATKKSCEKLHYHPNNDCEVEDKRIYKIINMFEDKYDINLDEKLKTRWEYQELSSQSLITVNFRRNSRLDTSNEDKKEVTAKEDTNALDDITNEDMILNSNIKQRKTTYLDKLPEIEKQAGAELVQAQPKLVL